MTTETIITSAVIVALLSAILFAIGNPKNDTLTIKIETSEEETPPVIEEVVKPKRKYKKRVSKKNTIATVATKKPVGRPRKTVE